MSEGKDTSDIGERFSQVPPDILRTPEAEAGRDEAHLAGLRDGSIVDLEAHQIVLAVRDSLAFHNESFSGMRQRVGLQKYRARQTL